MASKERSRSKRSTTDGLRRLKEAQRGGWDPGASTFTLGAGSDRYDLDVIGNWNFSALDEDGNASFTDPGEKTERTNNMANEVTLLDIVQGAFDPLDPNVPPTTYVDVPLVIAWDHAGNMLTRDEHLGGGLTAEHVYTHDAWNRLVKVEAGGLDRAAYEYNGLGWRVRARSDDPLNPDGVYDEERVMAYDASWRMLEELIDDDLDAPGGPGADRAAQQVWGLRYIDDAVLRRTNDDLTDDGSGITYDATLYYCTDVNFSPLAVIDGTALLVNRVRYRPYGFARHQYPGDLNEDGTVSSGEVTAITGAGTIPITGGSYDPNMDIDRNGVVDGTNDGALVSVKAPLPEGWVGSRESAGSFLAAEGSHAYDETLVYLHQRDGSSIVATNGIRLSNINAPGRHHFGQPRATATPPFHGGRIPGCPRRIETLDGIDDDGWCSEGRSSYHDNNRCFRSYGSGTSGGQQCCYNDNGDLVTSGPGAGTIDRQGPAIGEDSNGECANDPKRAGWHYIWDVVPYEDDPSAYLEIQCCLRRMRIPSGTPGPGVTDGELGMAYRECRNRVRCREEFCR